MASLLAAMTALPRGAVASEDASVYLSYDEAAKIAVSENPDIATLRHQEDALSIRSSQALAPNEPTLVFNQNDNYASANALAAGVPSSTYGSRTIGVTWTLGFPGKALANSAALSHQSKAARQQALAKEIDTLAALWTNFISLTVNGKMRGFLTETRDKAADLVKLVERKYVTNQAAQTDLFNSRVAVANLNHDLLVNQNERDLLYTQFRNLIRRPAAGNLFPQVPNEIVIPPLTQNFDQLAAIMMRNRHQLLSARESVEASESALTNASLQALPDLQLSITKNSYNDRVGSSSPISPTIMDTWSFGVGVAIPIFYVFNELQGTRAARRDRDAAQTQEESARLQALSDLQNNYTHFNVVLRDIQNLNDLLVPTAKSAYELMLVTYSLGKADYFRLNDSRNTYISAQKDLLSKRAEAAQTFTAITQQLGCDVTQKEGPYACR